MKWMTMIPLIGGSAMGCHQATGKKPLGHLSYSPFKKNDSHLVNYWDDVPYYNIDIDDTIHLPREVDFVNSVCPCAGLSMLNSGGSSNSEKGRGSDAIQNQWMYKSAEWVLDAVQPKVLWGENAPGLFTKIGEGVVEKLKKIAKEYDYSFSLYKTNTELHGIPQRRIRTFYFFWKSPTVPMMEYISKDCKSLEEYLKLIPKNATQQDESILPGKVTELFRPYDFILRKEKITHEQFTEKIGKGTLFNYLIDNKLLDECIDWLKINYPNEGFSKRADKKNTFIDNLEHIKKKLSMGLGFWDSSPHFFSHSYNALIARNMVNGVHPTENRYLNLREMIHLMGMPNDFELDDIKNINHIAQNVPVTTAKDMTLQVMKFLNNELKMTDYDFMKVDNVSRKIVASNKRQLKLF